MSANPLLDLIKKTKSDIAARSSKGRTTKIPVGKSKWRILPSWRKTGSAAEQAAFFHDFGMHYIKDAGGKTVAVYICVDKTFGQPCPVCEAISTGKRESTDDRQVKLMDDARATGRYLVNAVQLTGPDAKPDTPVILELPSSAFASLVGIMETYADESSINILDLNTGVDMVFEKTGTGLDTTYNIVANPAPRKQDGSVMNKVANLDDFVKQDHDQGRTKALLAVQRASGVRALLAPPAAGGTVLDATPVSRASVTSAAPAPTVADVDDLDLGDLDLG